ncbi:Cut9 interacting scn1 [Fusarium tjaetaba]|uniref:Cut9 interacting scn1 n=1 Tax=Fusarium tjaetaba TaxID=1567544 RepID=A0A8H5VM02_9HYPO|nr:Cut9 interacting scn1 [Fusarium tjaetaba]KAF5628291.1 Cut9 interacting scn1 [Fusarium tjaetaba]
MASITEIPSMRASALTIMATRAQDQDLVMDVTSHHCNPDLKSLLRENSEATSICAIPSFGWHPWFSHLLYDDSADTPTFQPTPGSETDNAAKQTHYNAVLQPAPSPDFVTSLPPPVAISSFLNATESRLSTNPHALVGEIGLDKAFRLPEPWLPSNHIERDPTLTPGGREGRQLSPYRVKIEHQIDVLAAQLRLAAKAGRAVSVHGVQAHGILHETLAATWKGHEREVITRRKRRLVASGAEDFSDEDDDGSEKPYPPRICLHSFSASVEVLRQYLNRTIPARIFVSLSTAVNLSTDATRNKTDDVLRALPDDSILVESDLHIAGEQMDSALEDMYRHVCEVKGWNLDEGVKKIAKNYEEFIFG